MPLERFPSWLKKKFVRDERVENLRNLLEKLKLHTVCQSARCPNVNECFQKKRTTFLILGDICTRNCRFCSVKKGLPLPVDKDEPHRIARFVLKTGITHAIITSVTRDDLEDGGAGQFADCISEIRKRNGSIKIEVLTSDFGGCKKALKKLLKAKPDIFGHNIETVPRLYKNLRPEADYKRSLDLLREAHRLRPSLIIKSGIMIGLGEREKEVFSVINDLKKSGCSAIAIGQYLRPSEEQVEVPRFIHPSIFERYKIKALELGFKQVASGPFVRSSYVQ